MHAAVIAAPDDFTAFRQQARILLAAGIKPADVAWTETGTPPLFTSSIEAGAEQSVLVPRAFMALAETVVCHRDGNRRALLYQALWRLANGEKTLLQQASDPLVHRLRRMAAAVRHDQHRMTAFVRFRPKTDGSGIERFVAWYEPQHYVLRRTASFFVDRFASMRFSIVTPDLSLHWDQQTLSFTCGVPAGDLPRADAMEAWWGQYYKATFNPARSNANLMKRHMPRRFWRNLPEAEAIQDLLAGAGARTHGMIKLD